MGNVADLKTDAPPSFVTDSATVATFKRHLKTYLFARSLSWDRDLKRYVFKLPQNH